MISTDLLDLEESKQLKAFLILIKLISLFNSNETHLNQAEIIRKLNLSKPTVSKYLKEAMDKGYIKKLEKGFKLTNDKIFIKHETTFTWCVKNYPEMLTDEDYWYRSVGNHSSVIGR